MSKYFMKKLICIFFFCNIFYILSKNNFKHTSGKSFSFKFLPKSRNLQIKIVYSENINFLKKRNFRAAEKSKKNIFSQNKL